MGVCLLGRWGEDKEREAGGCEVGVRMASAFTAGWVTFVVFGIEGLYPKFDSKFSNFIQK